MWLIDSLRKLLLPRNVGSPPESGFSDVNGDVSKDSDDLQLIAPESGEVPFPLVRPRSADILTTLAFSVNEAKKFRKDKDKESGRESLYIRPNKLLPRLNTESGRLELSTFCIDEIPEDAVPVFLATSAGGVSVGRVDFLPADFLERSLSLDPNWTPHRHVDVLDWPTEEDAQKAIALQLSVKRPGILWAEG